MSKKSPIERYKSRFDRYGSDLSCAYITFTTTTNFTGTFYVHGNIGFGTINPSFHFNVYSTDLTPLSECKSSLIAPARGSEATKTKS